LNLRSFAAPRLLNFPSAISKSHPFPSSSTKSLPKSCFHFERTAKSFSFVCHFHLSDSPICPRLPRLRLLPRLPCPIRAVAALERSPPAPCRSSGRLRRRPRNPLRPGSPVPPTSFCSFSFFSFSFSVLFFLFW
jgi:hypothetical protein